MADFPYYTEPTHDQGTVTNDSSNAARDTAVSAAEGRLVIDAVDKIFLLEANKHPLVTLLNEVRASDGSYKGSRMMKSVTTNPEFKWFEDVYGGRFATAGASETVGSTTIDVAGAGSSSAYIFTVGDVVKNSRTGENFLVTAIASATTLTVIRSIGTTAAAALVTGDGLLIVGNAN